MPCKVLENANFTFVMYKRSKMEDYQEFKRICDNLAHDSVPLTDIIIDFGDSKGIVSTEVGLLVRLLRKMKGSACALRIIGGPPIRKVLTSTNIDKLSNIVVYESKEVFFSQLKRPVVTDS